MSSTVILLLGVPTLAFGLICFVRSTSFSNYCDRNRKQFLIKTAFSLLLMLAGGASIPVAMTVLSSERQVEVDKYFNTHFYTVISEGKTYKKMRLSRTDSAGVAIMYSEDNKKHLFKNYTIAEE